MRCAGKCWRGHCSGGKVEKHHDRHQNPRLSIPCHPEPAPLPDERISDLGSGPASCPHMPGLVQRGGKEGPAGRAHAARPPPPGAGSRLLTITLPSPHQLLPILGARAGTKVQQSRCLGHDIEGGFCAQSPKCSQLSLDVTSSKKPSVNPIHPDLLGCPSWLSPPIKLHVNAH